MNNKIINILFLLFFFTFIFLITKYYFSEKNIIHTNKLRSSYSSFNHDNKADLPILKNDTKDIIIYKNDVEEFKKKRKKWFWERLISNKND